MAWQLRELALLPLWREHVRGAKGEDQNTVGVGGGHRDPRCRPRNAAIETDTATPRSRVLTP